MDIDVERLKVDAAYWDEVAPEGATHYGPESDTHCATWFKGVNDTPQCMMLLHKCNGGEWHHCAIQRYDIIPRPAKWSGDGLPPVGEIVEFDLRPHGLGANNDCARWHNGQHVEVLAHKERNGTPIAIVYNPAFNAAAVLCSEAMHPLKSDKDRAVEAALKVGREHLLNGYYMDQLAEALYDAGLLTIPKA